MIKFENASHESQGRLAIGIYWFWMLKSKWDVWWPSSCSKCLKNSNSIVIKWFWDLVPGICHQFDSSKLLQKNYYSHEGFQFWGAYLKPSKKPHIFFLLSRQVIALSYYTSDYRPLGSFAGSSYSTSHWTFKNKLSSPGEAKPQRILLIKIWCLVQSVNSSSN